MDQHLAYLRRYVRAFIEEGRISASPEYMKKERVRSELQAIIERLVADGTVSTQEDLDWFFDTVGMAARTLKSVPIEAFLKKTKRTAA